MKTFCQRYSLIVIEIKALISTHQLDLKSERYIFIKIFAAV